MRYIIFLMLIASCTPKASVKLSEQQKTQLWTCKDPDLTKISSSITLTLCDGSEAKGTMADCSADGQINCVAVNAFKAVDMSKITADKVVSGVTVGGVAGTVTLSAATIKSGTTIGGVAGTFGPNCSSDGQTDCLTTSTYKAVNTSALTAYDIRAGLTAGGIAGSLTFCKNAADTTFYDNTAAPAAAGLDIFDTIDDYVNNGTFPAENPFTSISGSVCSAANWLDVTADGACDTGGDQCVYKDRISGLQVTAYQTATDWNTSQTTCASLSYNGITTGWRLPTQKELMQMYVDGVRSNASALWVTNAQFQTPFWSATINSTNTGQSIPVSLSDGWSPMNGDAVATNYGVICVYP